MTTGSVIPSVVPTLAAQQFVALRAMSSSLPRAIGRPRVFGPYPLKYLKCNKGKNQWIARSGKHIVFTPAQLEKIYPRALVTTSHLPFKVQAAQVAQAKIANAAAGSANSGVIIPEYIRSVKRTGDSAVRFYGNKYGWEKAFAKVFAPLVTLFAGTAAVNHIANSEDSSACADQEVVASDLETQTSVAPINSRFGYFPHDGKVATTAAVAAVAGLSYATYKAYKNGYFSKLNPFRKTALVVQEATPVEQEVKAEQVPNVQAPIQNVQVPKQVAVTTQAAKNLNVVAKNKRPVAPRLCSKCHEIH